MAQFNLPQNSKIEVGKYYRDETNSKNLKKVNIYRWDPSSGQNPRVDTFEVDMDTCGPKVLDILFKIKNEIDPSLTIELTTEQVDGVRDLGGYYLRPGYYKDIAGEELTNKYKMWHLFCERPKWEAGKAERTNYDYISSPPEEVLYSKPVIEEDIDETWRREIAQEAGMLHGVDAYNEAMGY